MLESLEAISIGAIKTAESILYNQYKYRKL